MPAEMASFPVKDVASSSSKPLTDALMERHPIYAVIRGAAQSRRHTQCPDSPSGLAQQRVIRAAIEERRISPADISMLRPTEPELHW